MKGEEPVLNIDPEPKLMIIIILHAVLVKIYRWKNDQENNKYQIVKGKNPKRPPGIKIPEKTGIPPCIQKYGSYQKSWQHKKQINAQPPEKKAVREIEIMI